MSKTPDPVEVVRDKVVPVAEELVASVAERVAPLARDAAEQLSPVAHAAADRTVALAHAAAERIGPLTHQAVDAVAPYAQQAADAVSPYAHSAADAVTPYAQQAAGTVGPLAHQAVDAVAPYAALVSQKGREALAVAKDKVSGDVLPAVSAAASSAASSPLVSQAAERGKAVVQAAKGQAAAVAPLPVPVRRKRRWPVVLAVVAAAAGAGYVVVRRLVGDSGSQWQTARPTTPYVPPTSAAAAAQATPDEDSGEGHTGPRSAHQVYAAADGAPEPDQPAEGGETEVDADLAASSPSGVVGTEQEESVREAGDPGPSDDSDRAAVADRVEQIDEVSAVDEGEVDPPPAGAGDLSGTHDDEDGSAVGSPGSTSAGDQSGPSAGTSGDVAPGDAPRSPYGEERVDTELETVEERTYEEPDDAVTTEQDTATGVGPDAHPGRYDIAGAYVGVEPPEGYAIKGNERSMKYHLPDSNSYARTIAEVWFDSEEAAQQAGFTRAQH